MLLADRALRRRVLMRWLLYMYATSHIILLALCSFLTSPEIKNSPCVLNFPNFYSNLGCVPCISCCLIILILWYQRTVTMTNSNAIPAVWCPFIILKSWIRRLCYIERSSQEKTDMWILAVGIVTMCVSGEGGCRGHRPEGCQRWPAVAGHGHHGATGGEWSWISLFMFKHSEWIYMSESSCLDVSVRVCVCVCGISALQANWLVWFWWSFTQILCRMWTCVVFLISQN